MIEKYTNFKTELIFFTCPSLLASCLFFTVSEFGDNSLTRELSLTVIFSTVFDFINYCLKVVVHSYKFICFCVFFLKNSAKPIKLLSFVFYTLPIYPTIETKVHISYQKIKISKKFIWVYQILISIIWILIIRCYSAVVYFFKYQHRCLSSLINYNW